MNLIISINVKSKLRRKHNVFEEEIIQCFTSRTGAFLKDQREDHKTDPPTLWFVAETDYGRKLKVVFIEEATGEIHIKTAYEANSNEIEIYKKYS